jgi:hypothetical protein
MENAYWLRRKSAAMAAARNAESREARSAHYELAARYDAQATYALARSIYLAPNSKSAA